MRRGCLCSHQWLYLLALSHVPSVVGANLAKNYVISFSTKNAKDVFPLGLVFSLVGHGVSCPLIQDKAFKRMEIVYLLFCGQDAKLTCSRPLY